MRYLYVYSDNTYGENKKEVYHSTTNLKKSTLYKEANGRNILTIYKEDFWDNSLTFVSAICIN